MSMDEQSRVVTLIIHRRVAEVVPTALSPPPNTFCGLIGGTAVICDRATAGMAVAGGRTVLG